MKTTALHVILDFAVTDALGEDTDTTAAVAGGLAGLIYGINGIPAEWLDALQRHEFVEDIIGRMADKLYK